MDRKIEFEVNGSTKLIDDICTASIRYDCKPVNVNYIDGTHATVVISGYPDDILKLLKTTK